MRRRTTTLWLELFLDKGRHISLSLIRSTVLDSLNFESLQTDAIPSSQACFSCLSLLFFLETQLENAFKPQNPQSTRRFPISFVSTSNSITLLNKLHLFTNSDENQKLTIVIDFLNDDFYFCFGSFLESIDDFHLNGFFLEF